MDPPPKVGAPPVFANPHGATDSRGVRIATPTPPSRPSAYRALDWAIRLCRIRISGPTTASARTRDSRLRRRRRTAGVPRSAPACRFWRVPTDDRYRTCLLLRRSQRSNRLSRSGSVLPTMPPDDDNPIGMMISQAYRLLVARSARMLRDYGLSVPQMECLWALHDQPGISNAELAALLRVTPQAVSIAQRSLVDQGLITRSQTAPTAGCGRHSRPNEESGSSKRPTPHCGPTTKGSSPRCPQGIRPRCSAY